MKTPVKHQRRGVMTLKGGKYSRNLLAYLQGFALVGLATLSSVLFHSLKPVNQVMFYLIVIVYAGLFLGRGPTLVVSLLSVLLFDFLQVDPRLTLIVAHPEDLLTFVGLGLVGLIISDSAVRLREQVAVLRLREKNLAALNSLSRDLTGTLNMREALDSVVWHISETFGRKAVVFLREDENLVIAAESFEPGLEEKDWQAVEMAYQESISTGYGTTLIPEAMFYCIPLQTFQGTEGVLGIGPQSGGESLSQEEQKLIDGFGILTALAVERSRLEEQARQAKVLENTERLQSALLNSISHELRTPLSSITGALSTLAEDPIPFPINDQARKELVDTAYGEAQRLNLLVGNLLDMTRLESGSFRLSLSLCDIQDLIGICLSRFAQQSNNYPIDVHLPDDLPLLQLDERLMVQVVVNLLDNAVKFSPENTPVDLYVEVDAENLIIRIADRGVGIPEEDLEEIFNRFYRSERSHTIQGLGLGLSISRGIVEAHGGRIWAEIRQPKGSIISFSLPLSAVRENMRKAADG